jgi:hypothetical protein
MTQQKEPDPTKAGTIAQKLVAILINEDSETRRRAVQAAMTLLGESVVAHASVGCQSAPSGSGDDGPVDLATLFNRDEKLKPSDHAHLCAAYHFSVYGTASFLPEELRTIANEAGVVLPNRLDKTLTNAARNGKKLFQPAGKGAFRPTAAAGLAFKEKWGLKPGKKEKSTSTRTE